MKRSEPPQHRALSAQRLARFCKAARLWLLRLAGWLFAIAGLYEPLERAVDRAVRPFTQKMTRIVFTLIVLMAKAHLPATPSKRAGGPPRRQRNHLDRTLFGARLRKLARAKDPRAIIAALLGLLEHAEEHAIRLARRLANGLTRRLGGFKAAPHEVLVFALCTIDPVRADTS